MFYVVGLRRDHQSLDLEPLFRYRCLIGVAILLAESALRLSAIRARLAHRPVSRRGHSYRCRWQHPSRRSVPPRRVPSGSHHPAARRRRPRLLVVWLRPPDDGARLPVAGPRQPSPRRQWRRPNHLWIARTPRRPLMGRLAGRAIPPTRLLRLWSVAGRRHPATGFGHSSWAISRSHRRVPVRRFAYRRL